MAHAEVVTVDGFGNVQLSLPGTEAHRAGLIPGAAVTLAWDGREIAAPFVTAFGDVAPGELLCYRDSGDWVAIAVSRGQRRPAARPPCRHQGDARRVGARRQAATVVTPGPVARCVRWCR